jgi:uncharacterized protein
LEQRLSVVTLGVTDMERSRRFYEEGLGWKRDNTGDEIIFFQINGAVFALFPRDELAADARVPSAGTGFRAITLAYCARTREEVDTVLAEAEKAGARIAKPAQAAFWGGYSGVFIDPEGRPPRQLLEDWWSLVDVAEAAASAQARVSVLQACATPEYEHIERNGVEYHFMAPVGGTRPVARSENFSRMIRQLRADVFHVHGLGFPAEVSSLTQIAPGIPILLQDHANRVPRLWRRSAWRRGPRHGPRTGCLQP